MVIHEKKGILLGQFTALKCVLQYNFNAVLFLGLSQRAKQQKNDVPSPCLCLQYENLMKYS